MAEGAEPTAVPAPSLDSGTAAETSATGIDVLRREQSTPPPTVSHGAHRNSKRAVEDIHATPGTEVKEQEGARARGRGEDQGPRRGPHHIVQDARPEGPGGTGGARRRRRPAPRRGRCRVDGDERTPLPAPPHTEHRNNQSKVWERKQRSL